MAYSADVNNVRVITIPRESNSAENRAGWDFYGWLTRALRSFWLRAARRTWTEQLARLNWSVWGYSDRDIPSDDDEVLDMTDATDYNCLLNHCKSSASSF